MHTFNRDVAVACCLAGIDGSVQQICHDGRAGVEVACEVIAVTAMQQIAATSTLQCVVAAVAVEFIGFVRAAQVIAIDRTTDPLDTRIAVTSGLAAVAPPPRLLGRPRRPRPLLGPGDGAAG